MLDAETKRKIDNCRDILVGKIPDPKSQVEQITIALIYKFMDDMDQESIYMGGKPSFFRGEFEKYSWSSIFDPRISGFELLNLYGEALVKMNHNPNIPQLFRDIFKNAFLPYRDPETLRLFLKEIRCFTYDHSERLGDAFEYLLSVLSSQGEAGQFRTPRHIIDFIVKVVDPQLNQTILDPACGTAGFLISAYKHILKNNRKLSVTQKKRLMNNFIGYDISYDMVRLSLVNMYLHRFPEPHVHEYDTLTYEDRWGETYDIIMANPPFMSPKGGIRPHSRFSIKAKRSEVLFVDYIAEHLNPGGRAGVIVPEGIIFQSQNAYKALRKMLVENHLWAVVSLPAGVFNPYSGVKTSILLMDKSLAKRIDKILFVKIENDGFDLGAQRRPIDKNDLPAALKFLNIYKSKIENHKSQIQGSPFAHAVPKSEIAKFGDYNLSGDRYREVEIHKHQEWPMVELESICSFTNGLWKGKSKDLEIVPIIRSTNFRNDGFMDLTDVACHPADKNQLTSRILVFGDILLERSGGGPTQPVGRVVFFDLKEGKYSFSNFTTRIRANNQKVIPKYLWSILWALHQTGKTEKLQKRTSGIRNLDFTIYKSIKIPLPPLEIQEKIVAEIDGYQKIIDAARQIVQSYKPTIKINPVWPMVELSVLVAINKNTIDPFKEYGRREFCYIDITSVENGTGEISFDNKIRGIDAPSRARRKVSKGDVLLSTVRPNLKAFSYLTDISDDAVASTGFAVLSPMDKVIGQYVYYLLFDDLMQKQMIDRMGKGSYPSINQKDVEQLRIPLAPIEEQKQIVAQIEAEQKIVNENKKLIEIFQNKIAEVWGQS